MTRTKQLEDEEKKITTKKQDELSGTIDRKFQVRELVAKPLLACNTYESRGETKGCRC